MSIHSDRRGTLRRAKSGPPPCGCRWQARRAASLGLSGAIGPAFASLLAGTLPAAIPVDQCNVIRL